MSKKKLFDEDSDEEVALKTENEYAKKYDAWREKEELHKLEQKYGSKGLNSDTASSDSEDESDEPVVVTEEVEKQFLKTLSLLKTKDPRIYDPSYKFFDEKLEKEEEKPPETKKLTFDDSDDDDDDDNPNIFSIEKKAVIDHPDDDTASNLNARLKASKEDKLKDYLTGKLEHVDQELEGDLAPLRALWSDPKINDGEAFLRDYILNKRYLEDGDAGGAGDKIRDDEALEVDEKLVEEQGKFERAYNFRFEEPDDEYLKRFPRTMNYIRPKDDRRSRKRVEVRTRKEDQKKQKMEEIARLKALKLKEIQEKIATIKEVTGNRELAFKEEDIEGDFDPEEHDRRMQSLFDKEYYGEVDAQKPVFPDLDEELEIENWEDYQKEEFSQQNQGVVEDTHCEDDNFNMDADYDPKTAKENLLEELKRNMGKKRRNRKRKSKLAQLLANEKPKFVPDLDKKYSEFMEEYYKMDCEDVIGGDLPTRFKYRQVVPNDFGLTIEEILLADDKELTQWVPLKRIVKYRPENVEKGEVKVYSQKGADVNLKRKILPSLFKSLPEEPEVVVPVEVAKKKKKKHKKKDKDNVEETMIDNSAVAENADQSKKTKKRRHENEDKINGASKESMEINITNDMPERKKKKKRRHDSSTETNSVEVDNNSTMSLTVNTEVDDILSEENIQIESLTSKTDHNLGSSNDNNLNSNNKLKRKKHKNSFSVDIVNNEGPTRTTDDGINVHNAIKNKNKRSVETLNTTPYKENTEKTKSKEIVVTVETSQNNLKHKQETLTVAAKEVNTEISKNKKDTVTNEGTQNNLKPKQNPGCSNSSTKKKKKKNKPENNSNHTRINKNKLKQSNKTAKTNNKSNNPLNDLSDERLKAYGLNPKKYRSFLKYKKF